MRWLLKSSDFLEDRRAFDDMYLRKCFMAVNTDVVLATALKVEVAIGEVVAMVTTITLVVLGEKEV